MSVDILVFDKSKAPTEPMEFLKWFYKKSEWNSDRDYNDIKGTSQPLVDFFMELVKEYPSMNGEFAPTDDELEKVAGGGAPRSGPGDGTGQDGEDHQFDKGVYWDTLD